jgi:hypothetical protein
VATDLTMCDQKGSEMSLYYDNADDPSISGGSSCTTPTWVFNKAITGDMSIGETEDENELSSRDPDMTYKQYSESKPDLEITGELLVDPNYDGFVYMNAMRAGSYGRNILVLTTYISNVGAIGFKGKFRNFDRTISGPEQGAGKQTFKLKPAACVKAGCKITPVEVAVANAVATYDPGAYTAPVSLLGTPEPTLAERILESSIYKSITKKNRRGELMTPPSELFTDVGPLISFLGVDAVDKLLTTLVEAAPIPPENSARSGRRFNSKPMGLGGFDGVALLDALNNIALNV